LPPWGCSSATPFSSRSLASMLARQGLDRGGGDLLVAVRGCERSLATGPARSRNQAELSHLRQGVDESPGLRDAAVDEAEDEDFVVRDGFAGWWDAHGFALVGPGDQVPADLVLRHACFDE